MPRFSLAVPLALLFSAALASPVRADERRDLEQTIADLGSQTADKERIDALGAARVELSQIRGWLTAATNAVKEGTEKVARRYFDLVRAQMKLVDQLVALAQAEHEAKRLEREIAASKKRIASMTSQLEDKRVRLRAMKMRDGEK